VLFRYRFQGPRFTKVRWHCRMAALIVCIGLAVQSFALLSGCALWCSCLLLLLFSDPTPSQLHLL
jgi:hypothetical protein